MIKILCTTSSFNAEMPAKDFVVIRNPYKRRLLEREILELVRDQNPDGMLAGVEPITRKVMESSDNLKVISRVGVGLDSVDMNAAKELNIMVFNTPDIPVKPVAELTACMIYTLTRKLNILMNTIREGKWEKINGGLLSEKTIGIIGCGRIGTHVARLLYPAGAEILGYDPEINEHPVCKMVSFDCLIKNADVITLHIPYTEANKNMINEDILAKTRPGTIIINNSRGGLVDENALYKLLKSGHLGGAGLDVFLNEPYEGPLTTLENVILTPHIGSSAGRSRMEMEMAAVNNLLKGLGQFISEAIED